MNLVISGIASALAQLSSILAQLPVDTLPPQTHMAYASSSVSQLVASSTRVVELPMATRSALAQAASANVSIVPFYSQFTDITDPVWKKRSCGIASVAMLTAYYRTSPILPDTLLREGRAADGYIDGVGWKHSALVELAYLHGLTGAAYDYAQQDRITAPQALETALQSGPVIASVHYTFEPTNPIPHLVVLTGIENGMVYYNDPADSSGNRSIALPTFAKAWKQRYIVIRPEL